jgi:peptide-methionine (R)-S-oxide reductase
MTIFLRNELMFGTGTIVAVDKTTQNTQEIIMTNKIDKSKISKQLSPEQEKVMFEGGTERAFSSQLNQNKESGMYTCGACGQELFDSNTKFDSGTGWPSFYQPSSDGAVGIEQDRKFFMTRTEVHCSNCGAHLGHVFDDGPQPTGQRYCINGISLDFKAQNEIDK